VQGCYSFPGYAFKDQGISDESFSPDNNEIQLYGYAENKLYAFETINIIAEDALDVVSAIQWYAEYIDCPGMEILPDDPRLDEHIAM
jgi:predicted RNase H-like nuclease